MNSFIQQGHIKLIKKSDSIDINVTKASIKWLFWTFDSTSSPKNNIMVSTKIWERTVFNIDIYKKCFL